MSKRGITQFLLFYEIWETQRRMGSIQRCLSPWKCQRGLLCSLKHSVNSPHIIRLQRNQYQSSQRSVYKPCLCTFSSASVKISSYGIEGNFIKAHEVWSKVSSYVIWFSFEVAKSFVKWSIWLQATTTDFTFTFKTSTYSQDLIV